MLPRRPYGCTHTHTHINTHTHTGTTTLMHAHIHKPTHQDRQKNAITHPSRQTDTFTNTHTSHTQAPPHKCMHTSTNSHTQTQTHAYTQKRLTLSHALLSETNNVFKNTRKYIVKERECEYRVEGVEETYK
jgi:hypothetical protein